MAYRLKEKLKGEYEITLASPYENKILRMLHIIWQSCFHPGKKMMIDVYSGQAMYFAAVASFIGKYLSKKKVIYMLRGGNLVNFFEQNNTFVRKVLSRADAIYTPSQYLQQEFVQRGYRVELLENFIDLSRFNSTVSHDPSKLLWVRSFKHIYHPLIAIQVLDLLRKRGLACSLTMVGPDDGEMEACKEKVSTLGLDNFITFTGPIPNENLPELYRAHGIYLNTTSYESFGNALLEAAACGLVPISNAVGEILHMWKDGENIFLVRENNVDEYVDHITSLLKDEGRFQTMSACAQQNSRKYDWYLIKPKWISLLNA